MTRGPSTQARLFFLPCSFAYCRGVAGTKRNGGGVAPATGGFNGRSVSAGDGAISTGARLPAAASDMGGAVPAGGGMSAPRAAGDALPASGVCAPLALTAAMIATRLRAAVRQRPSKAAGFAAPEPAKPISGLPPIASTCKDLARTVFAALTALPQIATSIIMNRTLPRDDYAWNQIRHVLVLTTPSA